MKSNIFIPKRINVGYQNRSGTYTGKLAYIIYYDEKGVLRKERSWNGWRDEDIPNDEFDNEPTEGFVLNKKAGDYSTGWDHRQAYCRVYDPRGFEFEITIENLLYILANANCYKGKGLEGEFVYGWSGKDLVLMPVKSPDYKQIAEFNKIVHNNECIKAKDLVLGATYLTKDDEQWIYMGRFETYGGGYEWKENGEIHKSKNYRDVPIELIHHYGCRYPIKHKYINNFPYGKMYWFAIVNKDGYRYEWIKSVPKNKLITCIDDKCTEKYSEIYDRMESCPNFSQIDDTKDEIIDISYDQFLKLGYHKYDDRISYHSFKFISNYDGKYKSYLADECWGENTGKYDVKVYSENEEDFYCSGYKVGYNKTIFEHVILEDIYDIVKPKCIQKYLSNRRKYRKVYELQDE